MCLSYFLFTWSITINVIWKVILFLNSTPINKYISNNKIEYYKLFLPNDKTIEKITIILTSHTGNAELYSSRTNEYPSKSNNLKSI